MSQYGRGQFTIFEFSLYMIYSFPRHDIYICSLTEVLACLTMYCRYIVFTANVSDALARASTLVFITRCVYLQIHQTRTITESFRNQDAHIIVVLSLTVSDRDYFSSCVHGYSNLWLGISVR